MQTAAGDRAALVRFSNVAVALNRVAAERGPLNAAMTTRVQTEEVMSRLVTGRMRSDASLALLTRDPSISTPVAKLIASLARARQVADRTLSEPVKTRSPAEIQATIEAMFAVMDGTDVLTNAAMQPLGSGKASTILALAQTIHMLSQLRDYAGRMGSALIVPLATDTPVNDDQRSSYDVAHGRVLALADLLDHAIPLASHGSLLSDYRAAWRRFSVEGMALFNGVLAPNRDEQHGMTAADFTARIIPVFRELEAVRDRFFDAALESLDAEGRRARYTFSAVSLATLLMIVLECALLVATQRLIFRPLMTVLQTVLGLAKGTAEPLPDAASGFGEMRDLFAALRLLSSRLRERDALDQQNARMASRLRRLAERDGLTGILNRGALERVAETMMSAEAGPETLGLILLDIDHFKAVNDTFGHSIGDTVLKVTADRARVVLGSDTVFARFGGEEFAVILPDHALVRMREIAERLRRDIAVPIVLPTGVTVQVTASLGFALASRRSLAWGSLIERADAALYRAKAAGRNAVMGDEEPVSVEAREAAAA